MFFLELAVRVCAWITMYGGIVIALRLAEAGLRDSPFLALSPFEKVSNGGFLFAAVALVVSSAATGLAVILRCGELLADHTRRVGVRPHLLLWSRLALLLALSLHLIGEVGDLKSHGQGSVLQAADIKALILAVCFAFLLVLDALGDWTRSAAVRDRPMG